MSWDLSVDVCIPGHIGVLRLCRRIKTDSFGVNVSVPSGESSPSRPAPQLQGNAGLRPTDVEV